MYLSCLFLLVFIYFFTWPILCHKHAVDGVFEHSTKLTLSLLIVSIYLFIWPILTISTLHTVFWHAPNGLSPSSVVKCMSRRSHFDGTRHILEGFTVHAFAKHGNCQLLSGKPLQRCLYSSFFLMQWKQVNVYTTEYLPGSQKSWIHTLLVWVSNFRENLCASLPSSSPLPFACFSSMRDSLCSTPIHLCFSINYAIPFLKDNSHAWCVHARRYRHGCMWRARIQISREKKYCIPNSKI